MKYNAKNFEFPGNRNLPCPLKQSKTIYSLVVIVVEDNAAKETKQQIINEGCSIKYVQGLYPKEDSSNLAFQRLVFAYL